MLTAAIPEFRLPCDMVEASHFTPALLCNYTTTTAATQQRSNRCGWANLLALGKAKAKAVAMAMVLA